MFLRRPLILFFLIFTISLGASNSIYTSGGITLRLKDDGQFVCYAQEITVKQQVFGEYILRNDSLILSTHEIDKQTAVAAIYVSNQSNGLSFKLSYTQNEFSTFLPSDIYILKDLYPNHKTKTEYIWEDRLSGDYKKYKFNDKSHVLSVENYEAFLKNGKQLYYFDNRHSALKEEKQYKNGLLHGKSYYFQSVDNTFLKVAMIKEERYKNGLLIKTKTPEVPPIYYTSHF